MLRPKFVYYWPRSIRVLSASLCIRNTASFTLPRYRRSRGASHDTHLPPNNFQYVRRTSYFCLFGFISIVPVGVRFRLLVRYCCIGEGLGTSNMSKNDDHGFFNSFLSVWGISFFTWLMCLRTFHLGCFIMYTILTILFSIMPSNQVGLPKWLFRK